ncbi:MAG: AmmeMemoRadiSam system protein B [Amphritea sp.]
MRIKTAAVAGMFYPDDPDRLALLVSKLLTENPQHGPLPRALIVPHAGLVYSGGIAALAYNRIRPYVGRLKRVVLMGPSHRVALSSIATLSADKWRTPLGDIPLDIEYGQQLIETGLVTNNDAAHAQEHCLEVQLPFLQLIGLDKVPLVPLVVGRVQVRQVAAVIEYVLEDAQTLLLISSDLSHFHTYAKAQQLDAQTSQHIQELRADIQPEQACGCFAMNGLLLSAKRLGLQVERLGSCNSGDTAGDKSRVVGYAAYAFC